MLLKVAITTIGVTTLIQERKHAQALVGLTF